MISPNPFDVRDQFARSILDQLDFDDDTPDGSNTAWVDMESHRDHHCSASSSASSSAQAPHPTLYRAHQLPVIKFADTVCTLKLPKLPKPEQHVTEKRDTKRKALNYFIKQASDMSKGIYHIKELIMDEDHDTIYLTQNGFPHLRGLDIGSVTCLRNRFLINVSRVTPGSGLAKINPIRLRIDKI